MTFESKLAQLANKTYRRSTFRTKFIFCSDLQGSCFGHNPQASNQILSRDEAEISKLLKCAWEPEAPWGRFRARLTCMPIGGWAPVYLCFVQLTIYLICPN
jgi:hypothetical protein